MKKKKIKIPGGRELEIEVYDTEFSFEGDMTVEDYQKKLKEEEEHDRKLDGIANEIAQIIISTGENSRTITYWLIGDLIEKYIVRSSSLEKKQKRERYEIQDRAYERLIEKLESKLKSNPNLKKVDYSVPYLRKWHRLRKIFTKEQAERPVDYNLAHELLYKDLDAKDIDMFLDKCIRKEITNNFKLREAVKEFIKNKKLSGTSPNGDKIT